VRLRESRATHFAPGLPLPFQALTAAGIRIRPGQTSLTVAAPGVGKSQLWQNIAHRMGVPTLYWSADTDQSDVTVRTLAMWLGATVGEVEAQLQDQAWRTYMFDKLGTRADHIEWVFDSTITPTGLGERLNAYGEVHGRYPQLVVLDNLSNAITDPGNEYAEIKEVLGGVQKLARLSYCHIAVLHHAKGVYDTGLTPIPLSGGLQNPFKLPELGLTLHNAGDDLGFNVVKHRGGKADPGAATTFRLRKDFSRATIYDWSVPVG
jgi:hypothetical protein